MNTNELQSLDEALYCLNEGKITDAIKNKIAEKKIADWVKSAKQLLKNDVAPKDPRMMGSSSNYYKVTNAYFQIIKKYGNTKSFKRHKNEIKRLYEAIEKNNKKLVKESIRKQVLQFKKDWDSYTFAADIWEGNFLNLCALMGINQNNVIKHFAKSPKKVTYRSFVNMMFGSVRDAESDDIKYLLDGCNLDDECIAFYDNDDIVIFQDYTANKMVSLYLDGVEICKNLYDEAGVDYDCTSFYDDDYSEVIKEENIKFEV